MTHSINWLIFVLTLALTACSGGESGSKKKAGDPVNNVTSTISGSVTYDNVPHNPATSGLDYNNTTTDPVRGATVQLIRAATINTTPEILATTTTDTEGNYLFESITIANEKMVVRVRAELLATAQSSADPAWNITIVDNTNNAALYALDSASTTISNNTTIDLHAGSGWGTSSYTSARAAAPFHILDRAYDMISKLHSVDPGIRLPPLELNWSKNNVAVDGSITLGQIGTSYYMNGSIYILGAANSDTDEYDGHVIIHEMGHFFEEKLSRSDNIGGNHGADDRLDMRVAFAEGFGNAWAGIITDDPIYHDSNGSRQSSGFIIDVENGTTSTPGWYNESSIETILYDIYDSTNEGTDTLSMGLQPIYDLLVGPYRNTPAFTSIFSFITHLKAANSASSTAIDNIVSEREIVSSTIDIYGSTETNDAGGGSDVLPIYTRVTAGLTGETLCSVNDYDDGSGNKLSVFRFVRFNIPSDGSYTLSAAPIGANASQVDIDFQIFSSGTLMDYVENEWEGMTETDTRFYTRGDYTAAFYEYGNVNTDSPGRDSCFTVTLF